MATDEYKISVEMKAVNHRYLDLSIKMPKKFNYFEAAIRAQLKKYIQRGKVDVFISYEDYTDEKMSLKYNRSLAGEYMDYFRQMADELGIPNDATVDASCTVSGGLYDGTGAGGRGAYVADSRKGDRRGGREICRDTHTRG